MKAKLRPHVAALMLLAPCAATFVAAPAAAQVRMAAPSITAVQLNADHGIAPGSTLQVSVQATPNAKSANLNFAGTAITVPLRQAAPGIYRGSYTVRAGDRIDPTRLMVARVTVRDQTLQRSFNYPPSFQALAMGAQPASGPANAIERFVMRPAGRLEPGREIRFRLNGAPGGDAWVDIPGVIRGVDLAEVRPGLYEGTYVVRRRDDLDAFRGATASLKFANRPVVTARAERERDSGPRDERSPVIGNLTPDNGARVGERGRIQIAASLADDGGSGVDPQSVRIRLDGADVTREARVDANEVRYREDLPPGRHTVEVSVRDHAGNSSTKSWAFDVVDRDRDGRDGRDGRDRDRTSSGPLPLEVMSHPNGAVIDMNGAITLVGRSLPNANVRVQIESVANVAGVLGVSQPVLDQTVQADRDGNFSVVVGQRTFAIPGTRYNVHLTARQGERTAEQRITLHQRQG